MIEEFKVIMLTFDEHSQRWNLRKKTLIEELETVALTVDLDAYGLEAGDIGAVVLVHGNGQSYEVEFVTLGGDTVAVLTIEQAQIRRIHDGEIAHARMVAS